MSTRVNLVALIATFAAACSSPGPGETTPNPSATGGAASTVATGGNAATGGTTSLGSTVAATGGTCPDGVACNIPLDCSLALCGSVYHELCLTARDDGGTVHSVTGLGQVTCYTSRQQDHWLTCCIATCGDGGTEYQCGRVPMN
jgi:hypothetical protein